MGRNLTSGCSSLCHSANVLQFVAMIPQRARMVVGLVTLLLCLSCRLQVCTANSSNERTMRLSRGRTFAEPTNMEPPNFITGRELLEDHEGDFPGPDMSDIIGRPLIMDASSSVSSGSVQGEGLEGDNGAKQRRIPETLLYPTCTEASRESKKQPCVIRRCGCAIELGGVTLSPHSFA